MERLILKKLLDWKNTAYFNFDENEEYKQFFETTKDADRILQNLMLASGQKIVPEKTFIIFDEVQDCPKIINSMKYFCENAPQYHIACTEYLESIDTIEPIPDAFFNPPHEVDFLIQRENDIFPVEVKSEANTTSKSLKKFKKLSPNQIKLRVRFSLDNLRLNNDVLNIPLFMTDQTDHLIGLALEQQS